MLTLEVSLNKGGSMIAVSSLSSSFFPIYGVASAEVPFSAAVAEGRQLHDLKRSMPYWREAEKLRAAMEKWGITVQEICKVTQLSQKYIARCKRGRCNPLPIFSAFRDASNRGEILEGLADRGQKRKTEKIPRKKEERDLSGLRFPFYFDAPHNRMIREARLCLKITRKKMAFALRVSIYTIGEWEKGCRSVSPLGRQRVEIAARTQTVAE